MCTGVPVPSEEGGAEVPGPEGACRGEAGQVTQPGLLPRQDRSSDGPPDNGLERADNFSCTIQCHL